MVDFPVEVTTQLNELACEIWDAELAGDVLLARALGHMYDALLRKHTIKAAA